MKNIVIFASGSGTNAENIIQYFEKGDFAKVSAVFSNKADAKVLERAQNHGIPAVAFLKEELNSEILFKKIQSYTPDLIVLAGFLLKFPSKVIEAFPDKIINVHPALLPKYGGKGMYGMNVHRAILENNETETGISIHYVNEHYDEGNIIFQEKVSIENCETPEDIAKCVHQLEYKHFPKVIERLLDSSIVR